MCERGTSPDNEEVSFPLTEKAKWEKETHDKGPGVEIVSGVDSQVGL